MNGQAQIILSQTLAVLILVTAILGPITLLRERKRQLILKKPERRLSIIIIIIICMTIAAYFCIGYYIWMLSKWTCASC